MPGCRSRSSRSCMRQARGSRHFSYCQLVVVANLECAHGGREPDTNMCVGETKRMSPFILVYARSLAKRSWVRQEGGKFVYTPVSTGTASRRACPGGDE